MPLRYFEDGPYTLGMVRDLPPLALPPGSVYDCSNMLSDQPGILRQRCGSTALVSGAQTAFATSIGFAISQDATQIEELYGFNGKTGALSVINKTTGAATTLFTAASAAGTVGRAARHFGYCIFPIDSTAGPQFLWAAGQTTSTLFVNTANASTTAGSAQITLTGGDATTNIKVGGIVRAQDAGTQIYTGRVVSIDSGTKFSVWPVPTITITMAANNLTTRPQSNSYGGKCATSFQNRLLAGNTIDLAAFATSTGATISRDDRRVNYGVLPTETGIQGAYTGFGAPFIDPLFWPVLNYFDVPGSDPIVAMEPTSSNELLILTSSHPVIFRGNLVTELATTSPTITYDLSEINQPYGCLGDLSVQRTSRGIVWAGSGGVYAYDGSSIKNLCGDRSDKRIASYWRSFSSSGVSMTIHGSFVARNHYVISVGLSSGPTISLACNLDNLQWTRLSGVGSDVFYGLAQPSSAQGAVFAARWWAQSGAAPSFTNGQTLRVESMFDPDVAGATKLDADGTAIALTVTTRPIGGDLETQKMFQRATFRYACDSDTTAVATSGQTRVDSSDVNSSAAVTLTSLSNTTVRTISGATNATPIEITTTAAHGLATGNYVNIGNVAGNLNANGRYRITRTAATTFTLDGSSGSGAYTAGGAVQKITETDTLISGLNKGQAASFTVSASGAAVNKFELHGITIAALVSEPVMST